MAYILNDCSICKNKVHSITNPDIFLTRNNNEITGRNSESKESLKKSLSLYNVAGCFYILVAGLILALLVSLCELIKNRCKLCKKKV